MQTTDSTLTKAGGRDSCRPLSARTANARPASADIHSPRLSRACRRLKPARPAAAASGAAAGDVRNAVSELSRAACRRATDPASTASQAVQEQRSAQAPLQMDEQVQRLSQCFKVARKGAMRSLAIASSAPCLRECDLVYDRLLEEDRWWQALRSAHPQAPPAGFAPETPLSPGATAAGEPQTEPAPRSASVHRPLSAPTTQRPLGMQGRRPFSAPTSTPEWSSVDAQQLESMSKCSAASNAGAKAAAMAGGGRTRHNGTGASNSCSSKASPCTPLPSQCPPPQLFGPLHPPLSGRGPLQFSSAFESGNLCAVWHSSVDASGHGCEAAYDLLLQPDTVSYGHTQWFFFAAELMEDNTPVLRSPPEAVTVWLRILNFRKNESLFASGLKPAVWDDARQSWQYDLCEKVRWKPGPLKKLNSCSFVEREPHYSLSFTFTFKARGRVFFACTQPYTCSFLISCLSQLQACPYRQRYIKREILVNTLAGNRVDTVQVAEPDDSEVDNPGFNIKETAPVSHRRFERNECGQQVQPLRPTILVIARQHPGEAQGSWMAHGLLQFLTDPEDERAQQLRQRFTFLIVPMFNVDGVVFGNSRCSMTGLDLNRQWRDSCTSRDQAPEVWALKTLIRNLPTTPYMCLDLHAHSTKRDIFFYGCRYSEERQYRGHSTDVAPENLQLLPLLASHSCNLVSWTKCRSSIPSCKRTTARCVLFSKFMIRWVFTIEASVFATTVRKPIKEAELTGNGSHATLRLVGNKPVASGDEEVALLTPDKLTGFAKDLGASILELADLDVDMGSNGNCELSHRQAELMEQCRASGGLCSDEDDSGAGSDNCPSDDNFLLEEREEELAQIQHGEPEGSMQRRAPRRQPTRTRSPGGPSISRKRQQVRNRGTWLLDSDESPRVSHSWTRMRRHELMPAIVRLADEPLRPRPRNAGTQRDVSRSLPLSSDRGKELKKSEIAEMSLRMASLGRWGKVIRGRPQSPNSFRDDMRQQGKDLQHQHAPRSSSTPRHGAQQLPMRKVTLQLPAGWQDFFAEYRQGQSHDVSLGFEHRDLHYSP